MSDLGSKARTSAVAIEAASGTQGKKTDGDTGPSLVPPPPPASPTNVPPTTPRRQRAPTPALESPKVTEKPTSKKRKCMAVVTNTENTNGGSPRRPSKRARKQAGFGIQLIAGGQRSPRGRKYVVPRFWSGHWD